MENTAVWKSTDANLKNIYVFFYTDCKKSLYSLSNFGCTLIDWSGIQQITTRASPLMKFKCSYKVVLNKMRRDCRFLWAEKAHGSCNLSP